MSVHKGEGPADPGEPFNPLEDRTPSEHGRYHERTNQVKSERPSKKSQAPTSLAKKRAEKQAASWKDALATKPDRRGVERLIVSEANAVLILTTAPEWRGVLSIDTMAGRPIWVGDAPRVAGMAAPRVGEPYRDEHAVFIQAALSRMWSVDWPLAKVKTAVRAIRDSASHNPLHEYLERCHQAWKKRGGPLVIAGWQQRYIGAEDTPAARAAGRVWPLEAVDRALHPGCQADYMLVWTGGQGRRKSSCVGVLGGMWHLGSLPSLHDRDRAAHVCHGKWIGEVGEMHSFSKVGLARIKDWISVRVDTFRAPYDREPCDHPRTIVLIGTTNEEEFLGDPTGARRFLCVRTPGHIDIDGLRRDVELIWGEALERLRSGEQPYPTEEEETLLAKAADRHYQGDAWEGAIAAYCRAPATSDGPWTVAELLTTAIKKDLGQCSHKERLRVGAIMRRLGYSSKVEWYQGCAQRIWRPVDCKE